MADEGTASASAPLAGLSLLVVTNMYPSEADPVFGVFVKRQVDALERLGARVELCANTRPPSGRRGSVVKYLRLWWCAGRRAGAAGGPHRRLDAVVGHFLYPTAWIARAAARRAGVPLVVVAHGTDTRSAARRGPVARLSRESLASADLVVAVSNDVKRALHQQLELPTDRTVEVVHMGVDTEVFRPGPSERERLDLPEDERVILFVGNLAEVKGPDVLLEAFARMREADRADRLVYVGGGTLRELLEWRAERLDVADAVRFEGRLPEAEVAAHMRAADVLALPSRAEGFGLVLLEAMACGTPCVASAVGGTVEALPDPDCGRLVPPEDVDALADALAEVIGEGKRRYREACLERVEGESVLECATRFGDAVRRIVEGGVSR